jgi:ABC-type transport system involved in multi-copper enzyme maturation permease subunit
MPPLLVLARITLVEASRRRLLLALAVLTIVVIAFTGWGFGKITEIRSGDPGSPPIPPAEAKLIASQLLTLVMFMFSGVLALTSVLVAAASISGEAESGVLLAMLARPLSRAEVLLGKALGHAAVVAGYAAAGVALELLAVRLAVGYTPPHALFLFLFLAAEGVVMIALTMALSTRLSGMTAGVIALGAYFAAWLGGVVGAIGAAFQNAAITNVGAASRLLLPSDGLWRGALWSLEPSTVLAAAQAAGRDASANPFFAPAPPPVAYDAWCAFWVAVVLGVALWSFARREI